MTTVGTVESSTSRWTADGRSIVTDSIIRTDDGQRVTIRQLGGKVGDIRMWVSHVPSIEPAVGDRVEARVGVPAGNTGGPLPVLELYADALDGSTRNFVPTRTNRSQSPLRWDSREITVTYESDGVSDLPGDREFQVFDGVLTTWEEAAAVCEGVGFVVTSSVDAEVGLDDVNLFVFREDRWCRPDEEAGEVCYSPNAAAITTVYFIDNPDSERNGVIVEADIEINAVDFAVSDNGTTESSASCLSDLANTMTHEVGHLLGLDHTCIDNGSATDGDGDPVPRCSASLPQDVIETTMFPSQTCGETTKATPEADDIAGLCAMLELADEYEGTTDPAGCGCRASNGAGAGPWLLGFVALLCLRRRRHDGT